MTLERERITSRIAEAAILPVTLVAASAGYGKSVALDDYLRATAPGALRFNVRRTHASLTRFVRALAAAFEPMLPRIGQSLSIAHERASQSPVPSDVLAAWLAEHLGDAPRTIVIDDLHHCAGERSIAALLSSAIERTRGSVHWIVATRSSVDLPVANWLARGDASLPIDERDLRFTPAEARSVATLLAPEVLDDTVSRLARVTDGSPAIFTFGLATIAQEPAVANRLLTAGGDPFDRFADEVLARMSPAEREMLIESSALAELDDTVVAPAPQLFEVRNGRRQYHALFASRLRRKLSDLGPDVERVAALRGARALEAAGRISEALAIYIRERQDVDLVRVIEIHGFAFLEAGFGESIREAIDALDPLVKMTSSVVLAIRAMSESATGRFDTAESWFQLALDRAPSPLRAQIAYQYGTHLLRFFRREAVGVFESIVQDALVPDRLRTLVFAALGPAYVSEQRTVDARRSSSEALTLSNALGDPFVLAKAHHQAAYVALFAGDAETAKDLASISLATASEHGFYDVAAGALSVLYNVASDIDDDPVESLRLLDAMGDCAAKSGSLVNQTISLVAALEIEIERNNEEVAEAIDEKLRTLDVTFAGRTIYESLLPAQALRASWAGDFEGAYHLLSGSADQQLSPERKALRFAEIGAYAAAAGLEREAAIATRTSTEILRNVSEVDLRVQRTRLYLALAAIVLGQTETASAWLGVVDENPGALSRRLVTLRRALGALFERYRGARNHNDVLACLDEMVACGFAGVARALTMLPLADNALRRAVRLNVAERSVAVRLADGEGDPHDERLPAIARKLGCSDSGDIVRAVTWHREVFA